MSVQGDGRVALWLSDFFLVLHPSIFLGLHPGILGPLNPVMLLFFQTRPVPKNFYLIGFFPGKTGFGSAEMPVGRRLFKDGT